MIDAVAASAMSNYRSLVYDDPKFTSFSLGHSVGEISSLSWVSASMPNSIGQLKIFEQSLGCLRGANVDCRFPAGSVWALLSLRCRQMLVSMR